VHHVHTPCLTLTSAVGGALLAAVLAVPAAYGAPATAAPGDSTCIATQSALSNAKNIQLAKQIAYDKAVKARDEAQKAYDAALADDIAGNETTALAALNIAQAKVNAANAELNEAISATKTAQAKVDTACATIPPTTTTVPPPVGGGVVIYPNCKAAFAAGVRDIPKTDPRYRIYLDRDGDGIACELNEGPAPVTVVKPPPSTTIVNPPAAAPNNTTIVVPPAPSGSNFGQIGQAPAGAAQTGFGPNA
jgi:hypothetical protein